MLKYNIFNTISGTIQIFKKNATKYQLQTMNISTLNNVFKNEYKCFTIKDFQSSS